MVTPVTRNKDFITSTERILAWLTLYISDAIPFISGALVLRNIHQKRMSTTLTHSNIKTCQLLENFLGAFAHLARLYYWILDSAYIFLHFCFDN